MQQTEPESEQQQNGPKPPEYWTEANTAAWIAEIWGNPDEWNASMRTWGSNITNNVPKAVNRATLCAVIPAETMAQWRQNDPRPANAFYYDGTPITHYQPLRVKKPRAKKAN
jgi:hypothetical protein